MGVYEIDTIWGALKKYTAIAIIAGGIGFYKGCDIGMEVGKKNAFEYIKNNNNQTIYQKIEESGDYNGKLQ